MQRQLASAKRGLYTYLTSLGAYGRQRMVAGESLNSLVMLVEDPWGAMFTQTVMLSSVTWSR